MSTPVRWPSIILNSIYIYMYYILYIHNLIVSGCNTYQQHIVFYHTYNIASRKSGSYTPSIHSSWYERMSRKGSDRINGWDQWLITPIWSNYSDLTRPHPKWWFSKGNPLISGKSSLVKYYNLTRIYPIYK